MSISSLLKQVEPLTGKYAKKYWFAVLATSVIFDDEDADLSTGSFDLRKAKKMALNAGLRTHIAVIDADYDDNGNPTSDPFCIGYVDQWDF